MTDGEAGSIGKLLIEVSEELANMRRAHGDEIARAVAEERAAVAAWLRNGWCRYGMGVEAANAIERGEHRREGQP